MFPISRKKRKVTGLRRKAGLLIIILLIILITGSLYIGSLEDRFRVKEDLLGGQPLIKGHLAYTTEFCAKKLTELAHDAHFLERQITAEKETLGRERLVQEEEQKVIGIEQSELKELKDELEAYSRMCSQFDENPTAELCAAFLQEARYDLDAARKDAAQAAGITYIEITLKDLRNADRAYKGLQEICGVKR